MWAQFNPILMSLGLLLLGIGFCVTWSVYRRLPISWLIKEVTISLQGAAEAAVLGFLCSPGALSGVDILGFSDRYFRLPRYLDPFEPTEYLFVETQINTCDPSRSYLTPDSWGVELSIFALYLRSSLMHS